MIVITTPTGHIGSKVLAQLLHTNEKLRVIARDPAKLSDEVREKAKIIQGAHDDFETISKAYEGADQLFYLIPPSMQYSDITEYYLDFARQTCEAVKQHGVKRVIYVSGTSTGHEDSSKTLMAAYLVEKELEATGAATRVLHCGTFMENLLHSIQPIKFTNQYSTSVPGDVKLPWVATQDIADRAVRLLLDKHWTGNDAIGILGPEDLSYNEVTKIMSEVLDKDIKYQPISDEELKANLLKYGASEAAAQGLVDIYTSMENGVFNLVPRTPESSSPTTFREWCEEVFKPAFLK